MSKYFKMTRGVVLFFENNGKWKASLWLKDVKRNEDGSIKSGWVANGAWNYERRDNEELAKDDNFIVNRWPIQPYKEVEVLANWVEIVDRGVYDSTTGLTKWSDYNLVMDRAQAIMDNDPDFEFKFKTEEEIQNIKDRLAELEAMYDDDIPF